MNEQSITIKIASGMLEGMQENGIFQFKGIPFAEPPVGTLRWMQPQPVKPWQGIRSAKEYGPTAIQPDRVVPLPGMEELEPEPQSEDCLFLNVYTPGVDDKKRPVMFWIHGGAFTMGSGSAENYRTTSLVEKGDVVFVSCNYRLGELGFLRLKEASRGKVPATGNEGLLDQVAALKWVQENITAFGGDPSNVTVFGESAGAMSIGCLLAMPAAKGLFQKAILESGVGSTAISREQADEVGKAFLKALGIDADDAEALYKLTPKQILDADVKMRQPTAPGDAVKLTAIAPVIDGDIIPDVTNEMAKKGYSKDVAVIAGTNLDEYALFAMMEPPDFKLDDAALYRRLSEFLEDKDIPVVVDAYRTHLKKRGQSGTNREVWIATQTDMMFRLPAIELVEAQTKNGADAYSYLFTWTNPAGPPLGACHALEIGFVFGNMEPMFCGTGPDADHLSDCIQDAWLSFARTGKPGGNVIGEWPPYGEKRVTMLLDKECRAEAAPYDDVRQVWANVKLKKSPMP